MADDTTANAAEHKVMSGDEAAGLLAEFLDGVPMPRTRLTGAIRALLDEREPLHQRTASATVLPGRWRALLTERDAATARADAADARLEALHGQLQDEWRVEYGKPGMVSHEIEEATSEGNARYLAGTSTSARIQTRQTTPWCDAEESQLRAERPEDTEPDLSGWTAAENAQFEELYGVQAAMRLRASNDRVWQIVHELRLKATEAGLDPYQDPMAQRLSAALIQPEPAEAPRPVRIGDDLDRFLTDESRQLVDEFMAECAGESDDFDVNAVLAQNLEDAVRGMVGDTEDAKDG